MLTPRDRETLRKYLLSDIRVKQLNRRLISFLEQNFAGDVSINGVRVSASEQQKLILKSKIVADFGMHFLQPIGIEDDRIATAKVHNNEKDARVAPEQNYLNLVIQSGVLSAAGLTTSLPKGMSLRANIERLDLQMTESIIVVENLQAFDYWHLTALPSDLSRALAVYRGHDKTAKAVLKLLKKCAGRTNVIAFMDFDPKGLNMALTLPEVTHLLLPDLTKLDPSMSQVNVFIKQSNYLNQLKNNPNWSRYLFVQTLVQRKLAIAQETMLARDIPLTLFKL